MMKKVAQNIVITTLILAGYVALNILAAGIDFIADNFSHILGPISLVALVAVTIKLVNGVLK
jgi:hypothetical protein